MIREPIKNNPARNGFTEGEKGQSAGFKLKFKKWHLVVACICLIWLAISAVFIVLYGAARHSLVNEIRCHVMGVAIAAAAGINADDVEQIHSPDDMSKESYRRVQEFLKKASLFNPALRYIYTMRRVSCSDAGKCWYEFVVDQPTKDDNGNGCIDPDEQCDLPGKRYEASAFPEMAAAWERPAADLDIAPAPPYPDMMSGYAPVRGKDGRTMAIVGVDITAKTISQKIFAVRLALVFGALISAALLSFLLLLYFREKTIQAERLNFQRMNEERKHLRQLEIITRDLHDGIGGITASIGLMAEIGHRQSTAVKDKDQFERITEQAAEASMEVRELMNVLENREFWWSDLIAEFRRQGEIKVKPHRIAFNLTVDGDYAIAGPGLVPGMSLLHILKEALTNVIKHSGADRVDVAMSFSPEWFLMSVHDNGRGLDKRQVQGRGLANMRTRAVVLGGIMNVRSDGGTNLEFELPIPLKSPEQGMADEQSN